MFRFGFVQAAINVFDPIHCHSLSHLEYEQLNVMHESARGVPFHDLGESNTFMMKQESSDDLEQAKAGPFRPAFKW